MSASGRGVLDETIEMWRRTDEGRRHYIERHIADLATRAGVVMQGEAADAWKAALMLLRAAAEPEAKAPEVKCDFCGKPVEALMRIISGDHAGRSEYLPCRHLVRR